MTPHVAQKARSSAIDGRTTRHTGKSSAPSSHLPSAAAPAAATSMRVSIEAASEEVCNRFANGSETAEVIG